MPPQITSTTHHVQHTNTKYKSASNSWSGCLPFESRGVDSLGRFIQSNVSLPMPLPFLQGGMNMAERSRIRGSERYDYLYPVFWQLCFHGQHLSSIYVRIVGLIEGLFQLLQLVGCEDCPEGSKTLWSKNRRSRSKDDEESEKRTQKLEKPG